MKLASLRALLLIAVCMPSAASSPPSPEIQHLIKAFSGTWSIVLKTDPNYQLPKGGTGHGEVVWRPGPGGLSLIEEYYSTGDEGELSGLGVVWWDKGVQKYQVLWCDSSAPGCASLRGGARWENAQLVASDDSEKAGKQAALREVFSKTTRNSYTQTIYVGEAANALKRVLTIAATRKATSREMHTGLFKPKSDAAQTGSLQMPGPQVQNSMLGTWSMALNYESSPEFPKGATGQATEVWWAGPGGYTMIEEYYQNDANEHIEEFSPAWWDAQAGGQRFLYCGNTLPGGCYIPEVVFRWEGDSLVLRQEREREGKKFIYSLVFRDITPTSFTQINQEADSGKPPKPTLTLHATRIYIARQ